MYDGPSRLTGELATARYVETVLMKLPASGRVVRARVLQRHEQGQVTAEWGGLKITGFPEPLGAAE